MRKNPVNNIRIIIITIKTKIVIVIIILILLLIIIGLVSLRNSHASWAHGTLQSWLTFFPEMLSHIINTVYKIIKYKTNDLYSTGDYTVVNSTRGLYKVYCSCWEKI